MKKILFIILIGFISSCETAPPTVEYIGHKLPVKTKVISRIAFGSGCKQNRSLEFWDNIHQTKPDLWIWGGDNIYSDTEDREVLRRNYELLKKDKYYQDFISDVPVIGVWDDHDYGARDGGEEYPIKKESKEEFLRFFDIPEDSEIREHDGIYTSYELGDDIEKIKIYLLDNRYFKTELQKDTLTNNWYVEDSSGTVLGDKQWSWLEKEVEKSQSNINIFICGIQLIPNNHIFEKWGNFPKERNRFFDLLVRKNVKNPIILSGDRHFAEYSEYFLSNGKMVFEFTSSGMTHSYVGVDEENINRVGGIYDKKNFGVVDIERGDSSYMIFSIYDIQGAKVSSIKIKLE